MEEILKKTYLILLLWVHSHTTDAEVIHSKIIQNDNKTEKVFASRGGMEGWAWASFLVGVDGKPKNIVVLDYSGKQRYIKNTHAYVNNLVYSPTTINGVPNVSEDSIFLKHTFSGSGYNVGNVTPAFIKEYQAAVDVLNSSKNITNVRALIDNLKDDHTKNLHEHALAAWLESIYYYKTKDFLEYMRQSQITLELYKYLPLKILSKSVVNLFEAQLHYGYYTEAAHTLDSMNKIDGLNLPPQVANKFREQLKAKMTSNLPMKVKGKLSVLGAWIYNNNMQNFKLTEVSGTVDSIEVRCTGFFQKYTEGWQTSMKIPPHAKDCFTLIQGKKGTTFELSEILE